MSRLVFGIIIPVVFLVLLEVKVMEVMSVNEVINTTWGYSFLIVSALGYISGFLGIAMRSNDVIRRPMYNISVGIFFAFVLHRLLFLVFIIGYGIFRLVIQIDISESVLISLLLLSYIPLIALTYGVLWGKYRYQLEKLDIYFKDLPEAFDGFTIVQITDIHSGTWDSISGVKKGIKIIESQQADMIVFTGDLVNSDKDEIDPFINLFARLEAPFGKYAVLGNHDYYGQPRDRSMRKAYFTDFFKKYEEMGFDLILNDSRKIVRGKDYIRLIGVENWGSGRFFPKRGDLDQATQQVEKSDFTILLSHDPSHWDHMVLDYPQQFHLTLSGHTHGMQFGINLPFFKWSPVQYRYKRWMGLYQQGSERLYVSRGFGTLGFPGRVGMSPEVTLIKLLKEG